MADAQSTAPLTLDCGCSLGRDAEGQLTLTPVCADHMQNPAALADLVTTYGLNATPAAQTTTPTFTYSGDPSASPLDQVRFLLGDTNANAPYLQDGEIAWLLTDAGGDALSAAIRGCETMIAKVSGLRDESVGSVSISFSQTASGLARLMKTLQTRLARRALPFCGGISRTQKTITRLDRDRVTPMFETRMQQARTAPDDYEPSD